MLKSYQLKFGFFAILLCCCINLKAQIFSPKPAFELPTKEVYDLMVDRHGFLWIANDLGVTRYDGVNTTNYTNPEQTSIACTGLLEDKQGRIWFNNFSGQIFYIENETMKLLKSYDAKKENTYPHIALFKDDLISTSDHGLFILNTATFASKYIKCSNFAIPAISSIAILSDQVLAYCNASWFLYKPGGSFKKVTFVGENNRISGEVALINDATYRDTAYFMSNPLGIVKKIVVKNDSVFLAQKFQFNSFINTFSIEADNQWVNTREGSYSLTTGQKIQGLNISDIVTDHEGNKWFSSLNHGLLVSYKQDVTNKIPISDLDSTDLLSSVAPYRKKLLFGTQNGILLLYDPVLKVTDWKIKFQQNPGSINTIGAINENEFVIASSILTYKINVDTKKITEIPNIKAVKQVYRSGDILYLASSSGLFVFPSGNPATFKTEVTAKFGNLLQYDAQGNFFKYNKRVRAVCYCPETQSLFISLKTGVYEINKAGIKPVLFDNNPVYAAALCYADHKVFIGSISNGLLIIEKHETKRISDKNGLFSTTIFKFKPIGNHLWIIGTGPLQLFDIPSLTPLNNYELPSKNNAQVSDVEEINHRIYITTFSGALNFSLNEATIKNRPQNFLLSVKINDLQAANEKNLSLSYLNNTVLFKIGIPSYGDARSIYIKYCLMSGTDTTWHETEPGERIINFSSLMPGKYKFKAVAVNPRLGMAASMVVYDFKVMPPWWLRLWFKLVVTVIVFLLICYVYLSETLKQSVLRTAFYKQQELIIAERKRISSEIHDDIGAGIFAIRLYADLAGKKRNDVEEIGQIRMMIDELSDKIKEIIWSTNVDNDNLDNLLSFIQFQLTKLFERTDIVFKATLPGNVVDFNVNSQTRKNISSIIKELAHNVLKHSKASQVDLNITISENILVLILKDNGVGFNPDRLQANSMGLKNVNARIDKLKGSLTIENDNGIIVSVKIPLTEDLSFKLYDKQNSWPFFSGKRKPLT